MMVVCPKCGTKNRLPESIEPTKKYRCGKCKSSLSNIPSAPNKVSHRKPMSLAEFVSKGIFLKMIEKRTFGESYIRLGRVLTVSLWLYETGAILGRFWRDKMNVVVKMVEEEDKRGKFTQFWRNQAKKRLDLYGGQPKNFPIFVGQTDLVMFKSKELKDLLEIGDNKISLKEADLWLRSSMLEGIFFGSTFPDLTYSILVNEWGGIDIDSWKEARSYGLTLPEKPPQMTVLDKEKEAIAMARDYVLEWFPELLDELGLNEG